MAKLQIKSKTIATFGGVFPIMDVFEHIGLSNLIDSTLGRKVKVGGSQGQGCEVTLSKS